MGKKEKLGVGKIVKRVNKEFEKTTDQIEGLISDALKQLDHLQNQLQDPIRKILDEMDRIREREFARFQEEFDRRLQEFQELQNSLLERVGLPTHGKREQTESKPVTPARPQTKSPAPAKKSAKAKPANGKSGKAPGKKQTSGKATPAPTAKAKAEPKLSDIKGVGPATVKKMQGEGIASVKQIANPTPEEKKKLEQFASMKGYDTWQEQARKLLG